MPFTDLQPTLSPWTPGLASLGLYALVVVLLIALILFLTGTLGPRRRGAEKERAYECGIIPQGGGPTSLPIPFYLVALCFVVFDVEAAYLFSWAIAVRELGWSGWFRGTFFIGMLLLTLLYVWAKGGLNWGRRGRP